MRDIVITLIVFGAIPFILKRPFVGVLMWIWLSIMNPHRLTWGFAFNMPFAQIIAILTLVSLVINLRQLHKLPINAATVGIFGFSAWMCVSPLFPVTGVEIYELWTRALKIMLMVLVAFFVLKGREDIEKMLWVLTASVAFYGVKGGAFVIATGGSYRVWGPADSYIQENNALAIATLCVIPLMRYLQLHSQTVFFGRVRLLAGHKWFRYGMLAAMFLSFASAVGSYSRGALVTMVAMGAYFLLKSRQKLLIGVLVVAAAPLMFAAMPERWTERMTTISSYDEDRSAQGRINAWWNAWNLAVDRVPIGGGFNIYKPEVFAKYSPIPEYVHAAHSIYFQVLGEHGFGGLFFYLLILGAGWHYGGWVARHTRLRPDLLWARDLGAMIQVSMLAFGVGGAFLSLAYFDFPYYLVVVSAALREHVKTLLREPRRAAESGAVPAPVQAGPRPAVGGAPASRTPA